MYGVIGHLYGYYIGVKHHEQLDFPSTVMIILCLQTVDPFKIEYFILWLCLIGSAWFTFFFTFLKLFFVCKEMQQHYLSHLVQSYSVDMSANLRNYWYIRLCFLCRH